MSARSTKAVSGKRKIFNDIFGVDSSVWNQVAPTDSFYKVTCSHYQYIFPLLEFVQLCQKSIDNLHFW